MAKNRRSKNNNSRVYVNRDIRAREVRCINHNDENIGVISTYKAIKMAEDVGLDLVQISPPSKDKEKIPICKIVDSGKYKYDLSKRNKDRAKKQRESAVKVKEIKFRPSTGSNDLRTKAKMASQFISEGCRVKVAIQFKGRELAHKQVAQDRLSEFFSMLEVDVQILNDPAMDGRHLVAMIAASKKKPVAVERAAAS